MDGDGAMKRGKKKKTSDENVAESAAASSTPRTLPPAKKAKIREPPGGDRQMDNRPAWLKQLEEAEKTEKQATDAEFEAHLARVGGTLPDVSDGHCITWVSPRWTWAGKPAGGSKSQANATSGDLAHRCDICRCVS
jgi:hypothetical protein